MDLVDVLLSINLHYSNVGLLCVQLQSSICRGSSRKRTRVGGPTSAVKWFNGSICQEMIAYLLLIHQKLKQWTRIFGVQGLRTNIEMSTLKSKVKFLLTLLMGNLSSKVSPFIMCFTIGVRLLKFKENWKVSRK